MVVFETFENVTRILNKEETYTQDLGVIVYNDYTRVYQIVLNLYYDYSHYEMHKGNVETLDTAKYWVNDFIISLKHEGALKNLRY